MNPTRLLLADDHQLLREGLKLLLQQDPALQVIAETGDGAEVIPLLQQHQPQLAVLDHSLPGMSGLDIVREVTRLALPVRCLLLTSYGKAMLVADAIRAGVSGFVIKDSAFTELRTAVDHALRGELFLSHAIDRAALRQALASTPVSDREREVLRLLIQGQSAKEIAEALGMSPRTAETHRNHLMAKFDARNAADLVAKALESGYSHRTQL
jgi:DNA-binding NarL/FixJ family response regulator